MIYIWKEKEECEVTILYKAYSLWPSLWLPFDSGQSSKNCSKSESFELLCNIFLKSSCRRIGCFRSLLQVIETVLLGEQFSFQEIDLFWDVLKKKRNSKLGLISNKFIRKQEVSSKHKQCKCWHISKRKTFKEASSFKPISTASMLSMFPSPVRSLKSSTSLPLCGLLSPAQHQRGIPLLENSASIAFKGQKLEISNR